MVKLWQQTEPGEYRLMTLKRLLTSTSWTEIFGRFARREATFNYASKAVINALLAGFGQIEPQPAAQQFA